MAKEGVVKKEQTFCENWKWRLSAKALWLGLPLVLLLVVVVLATATTDSFWTPRNLQIIARTLLFPALIVPPMILVIASGGVDLSVGAVAGVVAVLMASRMDSGASPAAALLIGLLLAILVGLVNGLLVGLARVHSVIVTLGMATLLRSQVLGITQGRTVAAGEVGFLGSLTAPGIAVALLLIIGVIALTELAPFARKRFLGVRDGGFWLQRLALTGLPYVFSSGLAGLAGACYIGLMRYGTIAIGTGLEVEVILIVLLGGTVFGGGLVNGVGAILAVLTIAIGKNVVAQNNLPHQWLDAFVGLGMLIFGLLSQLYYLIVNWIYRSKGKVTPAETSSE
jgi:ribose/xylose/arabinose/galactoside ABC-type transport system permease subunit